MHLLLLVLLQLMAFASGVVISGAVVAFIASIGIVSRFAVKTKTKDFIKLYEKCITVGGIFGAAAMTFNFYIPIGKIGVIMFSAAIGVFVGSTAVSLAEILNIIPIFTRKEKTAFGIPYFLLAIALGKLFGSVIYYVIPGFYYN